MTLTISGTSGLGFPDTSVITTAIQSTLISTSASVASSALTLGLSSCNLSFRSITLTSGAATQRVVPAISLVVPSTATLGTVSAVQSRLVLLAMDATSAGGTVELAVVNIAGGNNLDETTLISTTAISATATSASVVYSSTARTSLPFRVVGYVDNTQATAGTWATVPSTVQGFGGQALAAMSSLGYGQTWQNMTASRVFGTTYYNTTSRPIVVNIASTQSSSGTTAITVGGLNFGSTSVPTAASTFTQNAIVPQGSSYLVNSNQQAQVWLELR